MKSVINFPLQTSSHLLVNFYLILGPSPSPAGGLFFILFIFFPSCPGSHFQLFYNQQNFQNGFLQFSQLLTLVSYVTSHLVFIVLSHSVCVCFICIYLLFQFHLLSQIQFLLEEKHIMYLQYDLQTQQCVLLIVNIKQIFVIVTVRTQSLSATRTRNIVYPPHYFRTLL